MQLKRRSLDGDHANEQLFRTVELGTRRPGGANTDAFVLSGWLGQTWTPKVYGMHKTRMSGYSGASATSANAGLESSLNFAGEEECEERRRMPRTKTVVGLGSDLRIGEWDFDALKCEQEQHNVLQVVGFELLRTFSFLPRMQLAGFLERLELAYVKGNPYHSHVHGADMCNALFFLAARTELWQLSSFADFTRVATIIAALGHDVGHFARNNIFLVASRHALAVTYNDRSVLESFHAATLSRLLDEDYGESLEEGGKLLAALLPEQSQKARHLMVHLILGTDTGKHLDDLSAFRVRLGATAFDPLHDTSDQQQTLGMIFRAADISHSAKEWGLHEEWSKRVVQEFHEQGDEEKKLNLKVSPLCDRENFAFASSQVGFLQFICLPTWRELSHLEVRIKEGCISAANHRTSRKSTSSSTNSSHNSPSSARAVIHNRSASPRPHCSSRCASPRLPPGATCSVPPVERRGSLGSTLTLLTDAAQRSRSQFLMLPLGGTGNKVQPVEVLPRTPEPKLTPPTRWVQDLCLANCERNYQRWKREANPLGSTTTTTGSAARLSALRTNTSTPETEILPESSDRSSRVSRDSRAIVDLSGGI